jgi:hypothetical protein
MDTSAQSESHDDDEEMEDAFETPPSPVIISPSPIKIHLSSHTSAWCGKDSIGKAACSGNERAPPKKIPRRCSTALNYYHLHSSPTSTLSTIIIPSIMIEPGSGQTLLSV